MTLQEIKGQFNDVLTVTELRGSYPNVPIAVDVDYAALVAGDDNPQFLTLPIAMVNAKSGNDRYYDEAFVTELMRQTLANRPIGLMGHLSETERATAFPKESLHWVGAVRDGDFIWGKAYIIGEARERVNRYRAMGKSIATSIDAHATGDWDESLKAFRMDSKTLKLNQIDLAPSDRAGISALARVPVLTTEMADEEPEPLETPQEVIVDKLEVINALTSEDARLLPKAVRDAVLAEVPAAPEVATVTELRSALGVDDKADLPKLITEMKQEREQARLAAVKARVVEMATPDPKRKPEEDKSIKIDAVRAVVIEMVEASEPKTVQEAEATYLKIATSGPITELLKDRVVQTMGPRQGTPLQGQNGGKVYFEIPQEA